MAALAQCTAPASNYFKPQGVTCYRGFGKRSWASHGGRRRPSLAEGRQGFRGRCGIAGMHGIRGRTGKAGRLQVGCPVAT